MNGKRQIFVSKINVLLLSIAWVGIALMLNLYENDKAKPTLVEVNLADEKEEEIIEAGEVSAEEETISSDDSEIISGDESTPSEEEIARSDDEVVVASDKVITSPNADIVPASLSDNATTAPEETRAGKIKVDAAYQSDPGEIFPWLMARGVRILLLDKGFNLFAEVDKKGIIGQPVRSGLDGGVKRTANAEVSNFIQTGLPNNTKYAVVWWPEALWASVLNPIEAYDAHSAQISYKIENNALVVTIHSVVTNQGTIFPTETVHLR